MPLLDSSRVCIGKVNNFALGVRAGLTIAFGPEELTLRERLYTTPKSDVFQVIYQQRLLVRVTMFATYCL